MTSAQLANRIREMRRATGLGQSDLAHIINVSPKTINAYEMNRRRVSAIRLFLIVKVCGWTMVEFFRPSESDPIECFHMMERQPSDAELDRRALRMMAEERVNA